jgi:hypothetical protein
MTKDNIPPYAGPYNFELMERSGEDMIFRCIRYDPVHQPPLFFEETKIGRKDPLPKHLAAGNTTKEAMQKIKDWREGE